MGGTAAAPIWMTMRGMYGNTACVMLPMRLTVVRKQSPTKSFERRRSGSGRRRRHAYGWHVRAAGSRRVRHGVASAAMDVTDIEPRILHVELPPESLATYRAIHDGGGTYAVVLTVSVGIDGFMERELRRKVGNYPSVIRVDERDRMKVEIRDTTLQQVRDRLDELTDWLRAAVGRAAEAHRVADLEDHRLVVLQQEINQSLSKDG
jgi:hypothetical protein